MSQQKEHKPAEPLVRLAVPDTRNVRVPQTPRFRPPATEARDVLGEDFVSVTEWSERIHSELERIDREVRSTGKQNVWMLLMTGAILLLMLLQTFAPGLLPRLW